MTRRKRFASAYEYLQWKYSYHGRCNTHSLPTNEGAAPIDTQALHTVKSTPLAKSTCPLPENEQAEFRDEEASLRFFIARIILGAWKPFKETPPRTRYVCVVLFILVQCILSIVLVTLLAALLNLLNAIYLVLAIITSYIALEVWRKSQGTSNRLAPDKQDTKGQDRDYDLIDIYEE